MGFVMALATIKTLLRVGRTTIGLLCFPVGLNIFQKSDLSVFHNLADQVVFVPMGAAFGRLGVIAVALSVLIPGPTDD